MIFTMIILAMVAGSFQGCMYYYKVKTIKPVPVSTVTQFDSTDKYLILHQGNSAWHLSKAVLGRGVLSGTLTELPPSRLQYRDNHPNRGNRYLKSEQNIILDQVHLYHSDSSLLLFSTGDEVKIDVSELLKAEIYTKASGRTTASWVVPAIGGTVLAAGLVVGIVAVTKQSCPLVYTRHDSSFCFSGEIFGGAIYASLERNDWLPLPGFEPVNKYYELKVANGLPEIQYINQAELCVATHAPGVSVLTDKAGTFHTIGGVQRPESALSAAGTDLRPKLDEKDQVNFQFDEIPEMTGDTNAINSVVLTFNIPHEAANGKLVVRAGNSIWGDYIFGELTKLFGKRYEEFIEWQGKRSPEKTIQWLKDQQYPLMVSVETPSGWCFIDYFNMIGPLGARDLVMPVNLTGALLSSGTDGFRKIRIKLASGFKFWDLDYVAMDFSPDEAVTVTCLAPATAVTETGKDVASLLAGNDGKYYIQKKTGEEGLLTYRAAPSDPGKVQSVFLHTKGYYTHVRNYQGPPDKERLQTFLTPGKFSRFSYEVNHDFTEKRLVFDLNTGLP